MNFQLQHDTFLSINIINSIEAEIYLIGDFNVNYINPTSRGYNNIKWLETKKRSRYANTNSCSDLFFINSKYIKNTEVLNVNISDHQAIFVTCKHISKTKVKSKFNG